MEKECEKIDVAYKGRIEGFGDIYSFFWYKYGGDQPCFFNLPSAVEIPGSCPELPNALERIKSHSELQWGVDGFFSARALADARIATFPPEYFDGGKQPRISDVVGPVRLTERVLISRSGKNLRLAFYHSDDPRIPKISLKQGLRAEIHKLENSETDKPLETRAVFCGAYLLEEEELKYLISLPEEKGQRSPNAACVDYKHEELERWLFQDRRDAYLEFRNRLSHKLTGKDAPQLSVRLFLRVNLKDEGWVFDQALQISALEGFTRTDPFLQACETRTAESECIELNSPHRADWLLYKRKPDQNDPDDQKTYSINDLRRIYLNSNLSSQDIRFHTFVDLARDKVED